MAQFESNKFLVLNRKFLKNLKPRERQDLMMLLNKANPGEQRYLTCNLDEPYAPEVRETIVAGETAKEQMPGIRQETTEMSFSVYLHRNVFFRVDGIRSQSFAEAVKKAYQVFGADGLRYQDFLSRGFGCVGNVQDAEQLLGVLVSQLNDEGDEEDSVYLPAWAADELAHGGQLEEKS